MGGHGVRAPRTHARRRHDLGRRQESPWALGGAISPRSRSRSCCRCWCSRSRSSTWCSRSSGGCAGPRRAPCGQGHPPSSDGHRALAAAGGPADVPVERADLRLRARGGVHRRPATRDRDRYGGGAHAVVLPKLVRDRIPHGSDVPAARWGSMGPWRRSAYPMPYPRRGGVGVAGQVLRTSPRRRSGRNATRRRRPIAAPVSSSRTFRPDHHPYRWPTRTTRQVGHAARGVSRSGGPPR